MGSDLTASIAKLKGVSEPNPILVEITDEIARSIEEVKGLPCKTEADARALTERGEGFHVIGASLEKQRKEHVDPLKAVTKKIDQAYAVPRNKADEGKLLCGQKVSAIATRIRHEAEMEAEAERKRLEKNYKAQVKRAEETGREAAPPPAAPEAVVSKSIGGAKQREVWTYKVLRINDVPAKFLEVKHGKILAALAAGETIIPGIEAEKGLAPSSFA